MLVLHGRQLVPSRAAPPGEGITVMSYNIHREEAGSAAFLPVIRQWQPDILALQEAIQPRPQRDDLVSTLEDRLGYSCTYRAYYQRPGSAGIAVCVAPPIQLHTVQRRTYHVRGKWSYLFAEMLVGNRTVNIVVPHLLAFGISGSDPISDPRYTIRRLRWASRWHHSETNELLRLISHCKDPTIMAGDFNSTPNQAIHARIRGSLSDAFQRKGFGLGATHRFLLPIRIDYVYVSSELEVLSAEVGPRGPSDHRPVIARIRLVDSLPPD
jgi:endonuclease/exonuclease/phosphatase (EEP) superfamily protein YafD